MTNKNSFFKGALFGLATLVAAGSAFAQSGIAGGQDGMHQISANTLGQWNVSFGLGGDGAMDSWAMAAGAELYKEDGSRILLSDMAITTSANVNLAMGFTNWLDIGANLPVYMDFATDKEDYVARSSITDFGIGDVETWLKLRFIGSDKSIFKTALIGQFFIPTGDEFAGVRPRHAWYLNEKTKSYTAGDFAVAGGLAITFDFSKYFRWNTQASYLYAFDKKESATLLYSMGFNIMPTSFMDIYLEASGEFRLEDDLYPMDPIVDPMIITPGFRFHITDHVDLAAGVEIAGRMFKNLEFDPVKDKQGKHGFDIVKEDNKGREVTYLYASSPILAGAAALTWRFGSKTKKEEVNIDSLIQARADSLVKVKMDSVMANRKDSVKIDTLVKVDSIVKVDTVAKVDTIAKIDTIAKVDTLTRVDTLKVIDSAEMAKNQAKLDSIAAASAADKARLDSLAKLSGDDDQDGIPNMVDKCPGTPAGLKVGADGCEVDTDNDGVTDSKDKCPASTAGAPVDENGCELDEDADGVVDAKDACPKTLSDVNVDEKGCPTNKDEDLKKLQTQISFKKGTAKINKKSNKALDKVAKLMIARSNLRIEIQGHCDEKKNAEDNQEMSVLRAQAVVDYLVKKGVPSKYVRAAGFGDTKLLVQPKMDKKGKKAKTNPKNNRVEFAPHVKKPKPEEASAAAPAAAPKAEEAKPAPAPKAEAKPAAAKDAKTPVF